MEINEYQLLLIEDAPYGGEEVLQRIASFLQSAFVLTHVRSLPDALDALGKGRFDGVVCDMDLPGASEVAFLEQVQEAQGKGIFILTSADGSEQAENLAVQFGADFIKKGKSFADQLMRNVLFWFEWHGIQQEHDQTERIISANPDAVIVTDFHGAVLFVNEAACKLFGKSSEELLGESLGFFGREGDAIEIEVWKGNEMRTAEMHNAYFAWHGKPACLASIRDITERKRAEAEIRQQAEELSRSNEELQQFAYAASHDLQEPLRTIISFAQLLEKRYKGQLDEQGERWIRHILEGSLRMQTLITGVLSYSRIRTQGRAFSLCDMEESSPRQ